MIKNLIAGAFCLLATGIAQAQTGQWLELVQKNEYGSFSKFGWNHAGDGYFTIDRATGELTAHGGGGLLWYSKQMFADFELELEFNCDSVNTNSGIFLRVPTLPASSDYIHHSFEVQIMDRSRRGLLHATGAIYDAAPATKLASLGPAKWNRINITCRGLHYVVVLNGETVVDWMAQPAGKITDHWPQGYIGLQNHHGGGEIRFRNIRVREFDEE